MYIYFHSLILNEQTREITNDGESVNLTPREYDLIALFDETSKPSADERTIIGCGVGV